MEAEHLPTEVDKLEELLRLVLERSEAGLVDWEAFDSEGLSFAAKMTTATVVVDSVDEDGAQPYRLSVLLPGETGFLAEIQQEATRDSRGGYDHSELARLYYLARSKAMNVGPVLDSLLAELRGTDAEGMPRPA